MKEFKCLRVLFTSEVKVELDLWIGAVSAVVRALHGSAGVKKELSRIVFRPSPVLVSFG